MSYVSKSLQLMTLTLLALAISGCSGMPLPSLGVVAPITNVGDEAETITHIQNGPDYFWQMLCIIGWMAPDPYKIWEGIKAAMKSVANFILAFFGKKL